MVWGVETRPARRREGHENLEPFSASRVVGGGGRPTPRLSQGRGRSRSATPTPSSTPSAPGRAPTPPTDHKAAKQVPAKRRAAQHVHFGGDDLDVGYDVDGRLRGKVGGGKPQTAATYRSAVRAKFPPGYYESLEKSFRDLLKLFPPRLLRGAASTTCMTSGKSLAGSAGWWTWTAYWIGAGAGRRGPRTIRVTAVRLEALLYAGRVGLGRLAVHLDRQVQRM